MRTNLILATDSYKFSHYPQYPAGTEAMVSYIEARVPQKILFVGLQPYINEYLMNPITQADIDEAVEFCNLHGEPFNKEGWQYILDTYKGYMPVIIRAAREGMVIPGNNALVTIECHDPKCFWVASFLETSLLRAVWYPTTVATNSWECKQVIKRFLEKNGTPAAIDFKLHDFGGRGVSSAESAGLGGMAHLVNFMGSDTVEGIRFANHYYNVKMAGFSIPAAEHNTITSWGQANEKEAYRNMINTYGGPGKMYACVSDSYDILNACDIWGELKDEIIAKGGTLVVRPDSGDPPTTVVAVVKRLMEHFGYTENAKGYKVLPDYIRVIQGDGINKTSINEILAQMDYWKLSADNVAFGMGGALLQQVNRDTYAFAMKCCALKVNGEWQDVYKIAPGKNSKRGRLTLVKVNGNYETRRIEECGWKDNEVLVHCMEEAYNLVATPDGFQPWMRVQNFDELRKNANLG